MADWKVASNLYPIVERQHMAGTAPRLPERFRGESDDLDPNFNVSELASEAAGAHSPFGETQFPMPIEELDYRHPSPANMPNLAGGH
jgi:hypothetical protein